MQLTCIFPAIDYGSPPDVSNANAIWNGTAVGSVAVYTCTDGMQSAETQQVWCTTDGWQASSLECHGKNDNIYSGCSQYQDLFCVHFFHFKKQKRINIFETGILILYFNILLTEKDCGEVPHIYHAVPEAPGTTYGSTASYSCIDGYKAATDSNIITCQEDGRWSPSQFFCTGIIYAEFLICSSMNNAHIPYIVISTDIL